MSYSRDTYEKKKGRRIAGSYGPPRKGLKQKAAQGVRRHAKIALRKRANELVDA